MRDGAGVLRVQEVESHPLCDRPAVVANKIGACSVMRKEAAPYDGKPTTRRMPGQGPQAQSSQAFLQGRPLAEHTACEPACHEAQGGPRQSLTRL